MSDPLYVTGGGSAARARPGARDLRRAMHLAAERQLVKIGFAFRIERDDLAVENQIRDRQRAHRARDLWIAIGRIEAAAIPQLRLAGTAARHHAEPVPLEL